MEFDRFFFRRKISPLHKTRGAETRPAVSEGERHRRSRPCACDGAKRWATAVRCRGVLFPSRKSEKASSFFQRRRHVTGRSVSRRGRIGQGRGQGAERPLLSSRPRVRQPPGGGARECALSVRTPPRHGEETLARFAPLLRHGLAAAARRPQQEQSPA